jgi:trans-aconitate 2-methyltransferase
MPSHPAEPTAPAWDPEQYLRHAGHRTRPFLDLLARIPELPSGGRAPRIADVGCGAGNVTALLTTRWPTARVTGFDNSEDMLDGARTRYEGPTEGGGSLEFRHADARTWTPGPAEPYDLIVSNAALQWVPGHIAAFPAWLAGITPGGTLALQVPGNFTSPSHTVLADLCASPRWRDRLQGRLRFSPELDPAVYLGALMDLGCEVDAWETTYLQVLTGEDPVLDWNKGTALRPVLTELADDPAAVEAFTTEYRDALREAYPPTPHGTVFPFRRLFAVARKPAA